MECPNPNPNLNAHRQMGHSGDQNRAPQVNKLINPTDVSILTM